ncbi:MAG TPA: YciI family protein [Bacteroidota bacterium]|nr:YciI family protein [Bacteroidota bacterium]
MRFMMLMIPEVYQGAKAKELNKDFAPDAEDVEKMTKYNEDLAKAGVLISLDGLHPTLSGARVSFAGGKPKVTDGPFTESKEVLGGYWMINVKSRAEAIEWAKRVPARSGDIIEVRQVFEMEEFPPDVQKAAESTAVRSQLQKNTK